jgi:hypothetical protein
MLRWRRARNPERGPRTEPARRGDTVLWQPRWHLQFLQQSASASDRGRAGGAPRLATLRELRTIFVYRNRDSAESPRRAAVERPTRRLRARRDVDRRADEPMARATMRGAASGVVPARLDNLSQASPLERAKRRAGQRRPASDAHMVAPATVRHVMAPANRRRVSDVPPALAVARHRPMAPALDWRGAAPANAPRVRAVASAPMTWRSTAPSAPGDVEFPRERSAATSAAAEASVAASPRAAAPVAVVPSAPSPAQMKELDPRMIDRLADDVIRRVERRARIERERRGV